MNEVFCIRACIDMLNVLNLQPKPRLAWHSINLESLSFAAKIVLSFCVNTLTLSVGSRIVE